MTDFASLGVEIDTQRNVARAKRDMLGFVGAAKSADKETKTLTRSTGMLGRSMKSLAGTAVGFAATMAAGFGVGALVSDIVQFERASARMQAITRATTRELSVMRSVAKELGRTTEFTARQAAEGLTFLGMAGFSASEGVAAIPAILNLATAATLDLGNAADITSNIMSAFGVEAENSASVADVLASASSLANTNVQQLGEAMKFVGPVAASLEISMNDAAAAIGALSDAGIQGGMAGTSLRRILSSLVGPTGEAAAALERMGVALEDVDPAANSIVDVVEELADAGLSAADALTIFGDRGGPAILALTSQVDSLKNLTGELQNVEGAASNMADTIRDNLGGDVDTLLSSLSGLAQALGEAGLTAVLRGVVKGLTAFVRVVTQLVQGVGSVLSWVDQLKNSMFGLGNNATTTAAILDKLNTAIDYEAVAISRMAGALVPGTTMSLRMAEAKLREAQGFIQSMEAKERDRISTVKASREYAKLTAGIGDAINTLELYRGASTDGIIPSESREGFERQLETVQRLIEARKLLLDAENEGAQATANATAAVVVLEKAIARARDGQVTLNDEFFEGANLSNSLREALGLLPKPLSEASSWTEVLLGNLRAAGVASDGASGSAAALARTLYAAAQAAITLARALRTAASALGPLGAAMGSLAARTTAVGTATSAIGRVFGKVLGGPAIRSAANILGNIGSKLAYMHQTATLAAGSIGGDGGGGGGGGGGGSLKEELEETSTAAEGFAEAIQNAALSTAEFGTKQAQILISGVNSLSDAFANFLTGGFSKFQDFAGAVLGTLRKLLADMLSMIIRNRIIIPIVAQFSGGGFGGSGLGGGLFGGLGAGLQQAFGGGIFNIFQNGLTASALTGFSQLTTTIGAALPVLGLAALAIGAFIKSTKVLAKGLEVTITGTTEVLVEQFKKVRTSYLFGLISNTNSRSRPADPEVTAEITKVVRTLQNEVLDLVDVFGFTAESFENFSFKFKLDLKGKSDEEASRLIQQELERMQEAMVETLGLEMFANEGETSMDTLRRLATAIGTFNEAMDLLGHRVYAVSFATADWASEIIELMGGVDEFTTKINSFFENYYTAVERQQILTRRLTEQFADLGLELPRTRAEFRALVESIDTTTVEGRSLYAELLNLSDAFARITPQVGFLSQQTANLLSSAQLEVQEQLDLANQAAQTYATAARLWYDTAESLREFVRDIRGSNDGSLTGQQRVGFVRAQMMQAFEAAQGGDLQAARDFQSLSTRYLEMMRATAPNGTALRRSAGMVEGMAQFLAGIAELEGANQDVLTTLAGRQVEVLESLLNFLSLEGLTAADLEELGLDQSLIEIAENFDAHLGAFDDALASLAAAIEEAEGFNFKLLKERLKVSVDILADANIPGYLKELLKDSETGIETTLTYLVMDDELTPDLRWLAVNAVSEHIKTIEFFANQTNIDAEVMALALDTTSEIRKTINFTVGRDIPKDMKRLALTEQANLSRVINVLLSEESDSEAIRLGLLNSRRITMRIRTVLEDDNIEDLMALVSNEGKLILAGDVEFDPSKDFGVLFESAIGSGVTQPLEKISLDLTELRNSLNEDITRLREVLERQAEDQRTSELISANRLRFAEAQERLSALLGDLAEQEAITGRSLGFTDANGNRLDASFLLNSGGFLETLFNRYDRNINWGNTKDNLAAGQAIRDYVGSIFNPAIFDLRSEFARIAKEYASLRNGGTHGMPLPSMSGGMVVAAPTAGGATQLMAPARTYGHKDTVHKLQVLLREQRAANAEQQRINAEQLEQLEEAVDILDRVRALLTKFDVVGVAERPT